MTTRRAIALMLAAALGGALLYLLGLDAKPAGANEALPPVHGACIVRFDKAVPYIYTNAGHSNRGCLRVDVNDAGNLEVIRGEVGAVLHVSADPDETFAAKGLTCGASGGNSLTIVKCFDRTGKHIRVDQIRTAYANLWLTWWNEAPAVDTEPTTP